VACTATVARLIAGGTRRCAGSAITSCAWKPSSRCATSRLSASRSRPPSRDSLNPGRLRSARALAALAYLLQHVSNLFHLAAERFLGSARVAGFSRPATQQPSSAPSRDLDIVRLQISRVPHPASRVPHPASRIRVEPSHPPPRPRVGRPPAPASAQQLLQSSYETAATPG
jgi:hypothetical protein